MSSISLHDIVYSSSSQQFQPRHHELMYRHAYELNSEFSRCMSSHQDYRCHTLQLLLSGAPTRSEPDACQTLVLFIAARLHRRSLPVSRSRAIVCIPFCSLRIGGCLSWAASITF